MMAGSRNNGARRRDRCQVTASKHAHAATDMSSFVRQWYSKHFPMSSGGPLQGNKHEAIEERLEALFSTWSMPELYNENSWKY
jgi:hypothetical protein